MQYTISNTLLVILLSYIILFCILDWLYHTRSYSTDTVAKVVSSTPSNLRYVNHNNHNKFPSNSSLLVYTKNGLVHGVTDTTYPHTRMFLGIPFAQPPVGKLRWSNPLPARPWTNKTLLAHRFSPACIQFEVYISQSEDCLYLNVYTPSKERLLKQDKLLPVIVYIYGGAYMLGTGSEHKVYDGNYIVNNNNVIIVTFNYRVGVLGFLVTNEFEGNFGIQDQRMALKWVKENIKEFGGDDENISLWGQSAGSLSALFHLTHNETSHSLNKAILSSIPIGLKLPSQRDASETGLEYARKLGCFGVLVTVAECLRGKSVSELILFPHFGSLDAEFVDYEEINSSKDDVMSAIFAWGPVVDLDLIQQQPLSLIDSPLLSSKQIIMGYNHDEVNLVEWIVERSLHLASSAFSNLFHFNHVPGWILNQIKRASYVYLVTKIFKKNSGKVLARFPQSKLRLKPDLLYSMLTNYIFKCPSLMFAKSTRSFIYSFNFQPDYLNDLGGSCASNRVCHAVDLPYIFHSYSQFITFTPREHRVSDLMISYFMQFILHDNVGGEKLQGFDYVDMDGQVETIRDWKPYPHVMLINDDWKVFLSRMEWDLADCGFWNTLY